MKLTWLRGNLSTNPISFNRPDTWFVLGGSRGSGKSSVLEYLGVHFLNEGHCILDLFGSRDGEGLAWLRSPYAKDRRILLLHGRGVKVIAPEGVSVKCAEDFTIKDIYDYDIIISSNPLYRSYEEEYVCAAYITDQLYKRRSWSRLVFCIVREAANLYYSRLMICKDQNVAKAQMTYLIREARHMGVAMGLDSLRLFSIDIDIRALTDFLVIKSLGIEGLPDPYKWLYHYLDDKKLQTMPKPWFVIVCKTGGIATGAFNRIPWHKEESEDILLLCNLEVAIENTLPDEGYRTQAVTTLEHCEIIRLRLEEKLSMGKIAVAAHRSPNTIQQHIFNHNAVVSATGSCPMCSRGKSQYAFKIIPKLEQVTGDNPFLPSPPPDE